MRENLIDSKNNIGMYNGDFIPIKDNISNMILAGIKTTTFNGLISYKHLIIKGIMPGCYLSIATVLTIIAQINDWNKVSSALIFPVGFIMLVLLGNELITGNFGLITIAYLSNKIKSIKILLIHWLIVYFSNMFGCLIFSLLYYCGDTHFGTINNDINNNLFKKNICQISVNKTLVYKNNNIPGFFACICKSILCNWMVTTGVMMGFTSKSTFGKIIAMWLPIFTFYAIGLEHLVVNFYVLIQGLLYNCNNITFGIVLFWNWIPATFGNIIGGIVCTALVYWYLYAKTSINNHRSPRISINGSTNIQDN